MKTYPFTMGIALVLLLAGVGNSAEARTQHFHCKGSGTFVSGVETHIDTNGDRVSANMDQGLLECSIGRFFFQEEIEYVGPLDPTTCSQGTAEYHLVQQHAVDIEEKTSDQLFEAADALTLCLNPDLTFSTTGHFSFLPGGTGHFTGASGAFDFQGSGKFLVFGSKDNVLGGFGQFTFTNDGTLTLPNDHQD